MGLLMFVYSLFQLFLSEGRNILLGPDELTVMKEDRLGRGAFATVYKAKLKKGVMNQVQ